MAAQALQQAAKVDWLTVIAITVTAMSINVGLHEAMHALTCVMTGSHLMEYSALYVSCATDTVAQSKLVAGSAPFFNMIAGGLFWYLLSTQQWQAAETRLFYWLLMLMNLFYAAGYGMFSGIANIGDMAVVIHGFEPVWLWRIVMTVVSAALFLFFVYLVLVQFGCHFCEQGEIQRRQANKLALLCWLVAVVVVVLAGLFSPAGFISLPVIAGTLAAAGALSPLLWMMQWFRAGYFAKSAQKPFIVRRSPGWMLSAAVVALFYICIVGQGIRFT